MNRNAKKTGRTTRKNLSMMETLESRTLMSAAPAVVGYLPDYQTNGAIIDLLKNTHFEGMTQLNYFSVCPDANGVLPETTVGTGQDALTNASTRSSSDSDINSLLNPIVTNAHNAGVKVDIVIGGAGRDSNTLTQVIRGGTATWNNLAASINTFAANHHLDGVDIDWEPSAPTAGDLDNYNQMLQTIGTAVHPAGLSLSVAVGAEKVWLAPSQTTSTYILDSRGIGAVDSINVMDYDLVGPGAGAPTAQAELDMQNWVTVAGAPASKLIMGVPFYGSATTLTSDQMSANDPWANSNESNTDSAGYGKLVSALHGNLPTSTSFTDNIGVSVYVPDSFQGTEPYAIWHFDGRGTIAEKTNFALNNYGGVMVWSVGMDSFDVTSADANGNPLAEQYNGYSLMPVIQQTVSSFTSTHTTTGSTTATPAQLSGTPIGTAGSLNNQGNTIAKVFDGNLNSYFDAPTAGTSSNPVWVGLDLGTAKSLTQIKFAARSGFEYWMEGGLFQAANTANFSSGTVNLYSIPNTAAPSSTTLNSVNVTAAGTYRYVRYIAPANTYGNIAEMQVFGTTPSTQNSRALSAIFSATQILKKNKLFF